MRAILIANKGLIGAVAWNVFGQILAFHLATAVAGCGGGENRIREVSQTARLSPEMSAAARGWPEADALFRQDRLWLGGDAAYSVNLGGERFLWLFGDSFIANDRAAGRKSSFMVRNSIAVQTGYDPSSASMKFYWRRNEKGAPASFFPEREGEWLWPAHGILVGGQLTVFLYRIARDHSAGSLGFKLEGWTAVRVEHPGQEPSAWDLHQLSTPDTGAATVVGAAAVQQNDHVYAFAVRGAGGHEIVLLRWPTDEFIKGDLSVFEWWAGTAAGWSRQACPATVMTGGVTEFSVSRLPGSTWWVQLQSRPMGGGREIGVRYASRLTGPWSEFCIIYRPPEAGQRGLLLYAGKAHPRMQGADLVATYVANSLDLHRLMSDTDIYFPRFLGITKRSMLQTCPLPR